MITLHNVNSALSQILAEISQLPTESVPLAVALGRVLAADVISTIDLPPFTNSSMDGFAVRADDIAATSAETPTTLTVSMDIPAGASPNITLPAGTAARIMTGAPLPNGADAVVPVEGTNITWQGDNDAPPDNVQIMQRVNAGDYVRPKGEDIQQGQVVLTAGTVIYPAEIGVLAALGHNRVDVLCVPKVAILASGDELVDVDEPLAPGKIRNSNSYVLEALVTQLGGIAIRIPTARDTIADTHRAFNEAFAHQPDLLLSSAGVSVGAHDVIRTVLDELGEIKLWRINMRPGKPLAYGQVRGIPFVGLPGNPVSAQVTFDVIVRPILLKMAGREDALPMVDAVLAEDIPSDGRRTYARVQLARQDDDTLIATTTGTQSSGAMLSMVLADGLLIIPENQKQAHKGQIYPVRLLKPLSGD